MAELVRSRRTVALQNLERAWASLEAQPNREQNRKKGRESGPQRQRMLGRNKNWQRARLVAHLRVLHSCSKGQFMPPGFGASSEPND